LNFHWKWPVFFAALEDLFNSSDFFEQKILHVIVDQSDLQQLFNVFPQSRKIGIEQLSSLQERPLKKLKDLPFLFEEFRLQIDQESSTKPKVEILINKMLLLLRDLSKVDLSENDSELVKECFEVCELIDFLLKTRIEINQILKEQMLNGRKEKSNLWKVLEMLADLDRVCPQDIWQRERFQLATFVQDQLPQSAKLENKNSNLASSQETEHKMPGKSYLIFFLDSWESKNKTRSSFFSPRNSNSSYHLFQ
jgi:hypothetical protein